MAEARLGKISVFTLLPFKRVKGYFSSRNFLSNALGAVVDVVGVDLGHDERNLGVLAPRGGVVDDDRAGGRELGGVLARGGGARREHGNVDAGVVGRRDVLDDDVLALEGQGLARGARGRKESNRLDRETPLLQQGTHDSADLAGGADDCNSSHEKVSPYK